MFDLLRRRWHGENVILCAFDLLELDGQDMRRAPLEERKGALAKLLHRTNGGIVSTNITRRRSDHLQARLRARTAKVSCRSA